MGIAELGTERHTYQMMQEFEGRDFGQCDRGMPESRIQCCSSLLQNRQSAFVV
jgi:hypothetical protein